MTDWQALIMLTQIQSLKIHLNQRTFLSVANGKDIHSPLPQGEVNYPNHNSDLYDIKL